MCGRYSLYSNPKKVIQKFRIGMVNHPLLTSYNIAPSESVSVILQLDLFQERILTSMRWGLIPEWHNPSKSIRMNNCARIETIETLPSFRNAFLRRRCLIPADGFFEWGKDKQPFFIQQKDKQTFAMAGIWEKWTDGKDHVESCCIITQDPNTEVAKYHDRMPVIVDPNKYDALLDARNRNPHDLKELLIPLNEENTSVYPVTRKMNKSTYKKADSIQAITLDQN